MDNKILFYSSNADYFEFSNFAKYPITINNITYPTSEHYFQSKKFEGTKYEEAIRLVSSPSECAKLGRNKSFPLRKDWEKVKEDVMMTALRAKFTQHQKLKELLLSTQNKTIIEHTKKDSYWADGGDGTGKNRLGVLLMALREELKN